MSAYNMLVDSMDPFVGPQTGRTASSLPSLKEIGRFPGGLRAGAVFVVVHGGLLGRLHRVLYRDSSRTFCWWICLA